MQLVINSPGTFITQKDECFRLKQKERVFDISPLKVESIVISNQAMISSQAVIQALEHNIDVIFWIRMVIRWGGFGFPKWAARP
jgi:CRISPR-associated protein Cas1